MKFSIIIVRTYLSCSKCKLTTSVVDLIYKQRQNFVCFHVVSKEIVDKENRSTRTGLFRMLRETYKLIDKHLRSLTNVPQVFMNTKNLLKNQRVIGNAYNFAETFPKIIRRILTLNFRIKK